MSFHTSCDTFLFKKRKKENNLFFSYFEVRVTETQLFLH